MIKFDLLHFNHDAFIDRFGKKLHRAVRRGLYKAAPDILDQFREDGLEGTKRSRIRKAQFKVRRNNTLAFIDSGRDARAREHGATIRAAGGGYLKVVVDPKHRENLRRDAAKGRQTDIFPLKKGNNVLLLERGRTKKPKVVAVLKKQVVRQALPEGDRLRTVVRQNKPHIEKAVKAEIDKMGTI